MAGKSPPSSLTKTEFAALVGYSPRVVTDWLKAGMPHESGGRKGSRLQIDPPAAIRWLLEKERGAGTSAVSEQTTRVKRAQADRIERENRARAGELLEREEVVFEVQQIAAAVVEGLQGLASRLAPAVARETNAAVARRLIRRETDGIRAEAAEKLRALASRGGGDSRSVA